MNLNTTFGLVTRKQLATEPVPATYHVTLSQGGTLLKEVDVPVGQPLTAAFADVAPGDYAVRVQALSAVGQPVGDSDGASITVVAPMVEVQVPQGVSTEVTP